MHARGGKEFLPKAGRSECGKAVGGALGGRSGGGEEGGVFHVRFPLQATHTHMHVHEGKEERKGKERKIEERRTECSPVRMGRGGGAGGGDRRWPEWARTRTTHTHARLIQPQNQEEDGEEERMKGSLPEQ